jgi:hypothetical protein
MDVLVDLDLHCLPLDNSPRTWSKVLDVLILSKDTGLLVKFALTALDTINITSFKESSLYLYESIGEKKHSTENSFYTPTIELHYLSVHTSVCTSSNSCGINSSLTIRLISFKLAQMIKQDM